MFQKKIAKKLFRKESRDFSENLIIEIIDGIGVSEKKKRTIDFLKQNPSFWWLIQGRFPRKPTRDKRAPEAKFQNLTSVVEFLALSLQPIHNKLLEFETFRVLIEGSASNSETEVLLAKLEERLGFSNWLLGQWVLLFPPGSRNQISFVQQVVQKLKGSTLSKICVFQNFDISSGSHVASGLKTYIFKQDYRPDLKCYLTLMLDPTPDLSKTQLLSASTLLWHLPAIDRWLLFVKLCQTGIVGELFEDLDRSFSVELLQKVSTIESAAILSQFGSHVQDSHKYYSRTNILNPVEEWIDSKFGSKSNQVCVDEPLVQAFDKIISNHDTYGNAAVLDRQAAVSAGFRVGTLISATITQLYSFTDRHSIKAHRWFELVCHEKIKPLVPFGRIGEMLRQNNINDSDTEHISNANQMLMEGDFLTCLTTINMLESEHASALKLDALLQLNKVDAALNEASKIIVRYESLSKRIPYDDLDQIVSPDMASSVEEAVFKAIVADACVRYGSSQDDAKRSDGFDDLLELTNFRSPSKAVDHIIDAHEIDQDLIEYFLLNICTPAIMGSVPIGSSTEELYEERISVLNLLGSINPSKYSSVCSDEIKNIAVFQAVRKESHHLDQQRVYVDLRGLQDRLETLLYSDFDRYIRFRVFDDRNSDSKNLKKHLLESHPKLMEHFPELTILDWSDFTRALTSESGRSLWKMFSQVREQFSSNHEFGLDGYLSGGIRHGNLESHLRKPLKKVNLLGSFDVDGSFCPPDLFDLPHLSPSVIREHNFALESFARSFQSLIDEILSEWIRIDFDGDQTQSFFDFSISQEHLGIAENYLRKSRNVHEFVTYCLGFWLNRVDDCLSKARTRIEGELRDRVVAMITDLADSLKGVNDEIVNTLVDNFVTPTIGGVDASIQTLSDWFRRTDTVNEQTVEPRLAVEIPVSMINKNYRDTIVSWDVVYDKGACLMARQALKHWVDIIHTLLVNAVSHSGLGNLDIRIEFKYRLDSAELIISNKIDNKKYCEVDLSLAQAMTRLNEPDALKGVRVEGKSGLVKVLKYARIDLRSPGATVTIDRDGDVVFVVVKLHNIHEGARRLT